MNIANKLSVIRLMIVPIFIIVMLIPESVLPFKAVCAIGAVIFIAAAITDALDGRIARRRNLITDLGKFLDPLADKFMVIGALLVMLYRFDSLRLYLLIITVIVVFREFAVTSARLIASTSKERLVLPANIFGKIKTVLQIVLVSSVLIETVLWADVCPFMLGYPVSFIAMVGTAVLTLWSGGIYIAECWKYINPKK